MAAKPKPPMQDFFSAFSEDAGIRLEPEEIEYLKEIAAKKKVSVSCVVSTMIRFWREN